MVCSISISRVLGFVQFLISTGSVNSECGQRDMDIYELSLRMVVRLVSALAYQAGVRLLDRVFRSYGASGASGATVGSPVMSGTELGPGSRRGGAGAGGGDFSGDTSDGHPGWCGGDEAGSGDIILDIESE